MTKNPPFRLKNYPLSIINIIVNNFDENPLMMERAFIRALNSIVAETESKRVRRKSLAPIFWNISPTRRSIQEEWEEEGSKKGACFRKSEFNSGAEFSFFNSSREKASCLLLFLLLHWILSSISLQIIQEIIPRPCDSTRERKRKGREELFSSPILSLHGDLILKMYV